MRTFTELQTQDWKDSVLKDRIVEKRHTAGLMLVIFFFFISRIETKSYEH